VPFHQVLKYKNCKTCTLWNIFFVHNFYYFHLTAVFPGKPGSSGSLWPLLLHVPEQNYWRLVKRIFLHGWCPCCHPTVSVKALNETQSNNPNQWPALILPSSITRLLMAGTLYALYTTFMPTLPMPQLDYFLHKLAVNIKHNTARLIISHTVQIPKLLITGSSKSRKLSTNNSCLWIARNIT